MNSKWYTIINPISGNGKSLKNLAFIKSLFDQYELNVEIVVTEFKHHEKKLVQNATAASQKYILEKAKDMDALGLGRIVRSNPDYKIVTLTEKERLPFKEKAKQEQI